ncbi:MAG: hypothetical protein ACRD4X_12525 [Candidatus Acidiferrales bacterium]
MRDVIPEPVFDAIQSHLRSVGDSAQSAWAAANAEEDTLTGDFCGRLRTEPKRILVNGGQQWEWNVRYKKFRGRGPNAFESRSGADGIIVIEVTTTANGESLYKSLLFQAKKGDLRLNADVIEQVRKMERIAHGSSAVFEYREDGYRAVPGTFFLERKSDRRALVRENEHPLGSFLGDEFLPCNSGVRGMYYDAVRERLLIPTGRNDVRAMRVELRHRVLIEVGRR